MIAALIVALGSTLRATWSFLEKKEETGGSLQDLLFADNTSIPSEVIQRGISFYFLLGNCLSFGKLLICYVLFSFDFDHKCGLLIRILESTH
jgi:hypothetical protein